MAELSGELPHVMNRSLIEPVSENETTLGRALSAQARPL